MNNVLINNLCQKKLELNGLLEITGCSSFIDSLMPVCFLMNEEASNVLILNTTKLVWPNDLLDLAEKGVQVINIMSSSPYKENRLEFVSGTWYIYDSSPEVSHLHIAKCLDQADVRRTPPIKLRHSFSQSV